MNGWLAEGNYLQISNVDRQTDRLYHPQGSCDRENPGKIMKIWKVIPSPRKVLKVWKCLKNFHKVAISSKLIILFSLNWFCCCNRKLFVRFQKECHRNFLLSLEEVVEKSRNSFPRKFTGNLYLPPVMLDGTSCYGLDCFKCKWGFVPLLGLKLHH